MIVVSDTSPITNLAAINQLNLLQRLYTRLIIPTAVYNEMVREDRRLMIFGNFRISDFLLPERKEPVQINPYEVNVQFSCLQSTYNLESERY